MTDKWQRDQFMAPDDEAGIDWNDFVRAVSIYSCMNSNSVSVRNVAEAFNTTDEIIYEAVDDDYWMVTSGPTDDPSKCLIEHDGE